MGRRHRQFRNRRGGRFCPAEPSRGVPRAVLGVDRLARCVVAVCCPARRRAQSPPYCLMGCSGRRSRNATAEATVETPAEATTEATAAAISAAADTSVAPGAFVFDTSVTEASSPEVATLAPGNSSVDVTPSAATAPSAAIVSAAPGASPASDRLPVCCRAAGFLPACGTASRSRRPPYGPGCGGAARCRRGAKRREPAGGTPRSRFSG